MKLSNGVIFQNRNGDIYDSDKFIRELETYIEPSDDLYAIILENNQLKAIHESTLWYGFRGTNVKLFLSEWRDKLNELNKYKKEKYSSKFINGNTITISRSYGDHIFTDKELRDLYEGKTISFSYNTQYGNNKTVTGKLDRKDWEEKEIIFWGFIPISSEEDENNYIEGIYDGEIIKFKNKFADHEYTEEEIKSLLNGNAIYVIITNKNNRKVAVRLKLTQYHDKYYTPLVNFEVPPVKWSGKEFSIDEIEQLHMGKTISGQFTSRSNKKYYADIIWEDGKIKIVNDNRSNINYDGFGNGDADSF